jgi:hypothetical protein
LGIGGIAPRILDLGTKWRWVVSLTPRPLYSQGKLHWYPSDRRLGGPQSRSGHSGEEKNSHPLPGLELSIIQPVDQRYTTHTYIHTNICVYMYIQTHAKCVMYVKAILTHHYWSPIPWKLHNLYTWNSVAKQPTNYQQFLKLLLGTGQCHPWGSHAISCYKVYHSIGCTGAQFESEMTSNICLRVNRHDDMGILRLLTEMLRNNAFNSDVWVRCY